MGNVIGELLPLGVGLAISPIPIIATILMLLTPKAKGTSVGFLVGWVTGIVVATTIFVVVATTAGLEDSSGDSSTSRVKVVLGVLLLVVALRQWRKRPAPGETVVLPKWMSAIDSLTFARATALGFALSAINPKNLLMCAAAGTAIGGASLSTADTAIAIAVFTVIGACTVAIPVVGYLVAADRMTAPLENLRIWLEHNNAAVMSVLVLVIGVTLIGKGIGGF